SVAGDNGRAQMLATEVDRCKAGRDCCRWSFRHSRSNHRRRPRGPQAQRHQFNCVTGLAVAVAPMMLLMKAFEELRVCESTQQNVQFISLTVVAQIGAGGKLRRWQPALGAKILMGSFRENLKLAPQAAGDVGRYARAFDTPKHSAGIVLYHITDQYPIG